MLIHVKFHLNWQVLYFYPDGKSFLYFTWPQSKKAYYHISYHAYVQLLGCDNIVFITWLIATE